MTGLAGLLTRWVGLAARHPWPVVVLALASAAAALHYAAGHLGMNTDTADMIARDLPWRQTYIEYKRLFPLETDTLTVVVDGDTPELAEAAASRLAADLAAPGGAMEWVHRPASGPFWERNGLLYLSTDALAERVDSLAELQPFIGRLARDPSVPALLDLLADALDELPAERSQALAPALARIAAAIEAVLAGRFHRLSWQTLTNGDDESGPRTRRFVVAKPALDYAELLPAGPAIAHIRALAAERELDPAHGVRVRVTGGIAMAHEELQSVSRGAGVAAIGALLLVAVVLGLGLRSARLVLASLVTLMVGLLWTAAFAAAAVGHLNLISVAFAVLYIGLGVDYAIHFCLRYRELRLGGQAHAEALGTAAGDVGGALALCALTTGIGFYAFVPTDFAGVSELGLISGTGMFVSLVACLTVLPALLSLAPLPAGTAAAPAPPVAPAGTAARFPYRRRRTVAVVSAVAGLAALAALPGVRFDSNPLNLRESGAESLETYRDLLADSDTSPWPMVLVVAGPRAAAEAKSTLAALDSVERVVTLQDFVPADQGAKLDLVEELALLLGPVLDAIPAAPVAASPGAQRDAVGRLRERLDSPLPGSDGDLAAAVSALAAALGQLEPRLAGERGQALADGVTDALLGSLPGVLARLGAALEAGPVAGEDLPEALLARWRAVDGRERVEIHARHDLDDPQALEAFVAGVRARMPDATGTPVVHLESGRAVVRAFAQAFVSALALVALLLLVLFRGLRPVIWVLTPLLLSALLTVAAMVVLGLPFNFANVIALPLLLGIGVDSGIHMVHRNHAAPPSDGDLLATSTARGVLVSALTTLCSFGNLAFSAHRGTASMGIVLSVGLALTLLCTLVLLPAMLGDGRSSRRP